MRRVAALVLACALSACAGTAGTAGTDASTESTVLPTVAAPASSGGTIEMDGATAQATRPDGSAPEERLGAAREAWAAAEPATYTYVIEYSCFCPQELLGPYTVTVTDGEVSAVEPPPPSATTEPGSSFAPTTIEGLHDRIAEEIATADEVEVRYDESGVPVNAMFDRVLMAIDDELSFFVTYPA